MTSPPRTHSDHGGVCRGGLPRAEGNPGVLLLSDHPGLTGTSQIEKFQEKAQMELQDYVQKTYAEDTYR